MFGGSLPKESLHPSLHCLLWTLLVKADSWLVGFVAWRPGLRGTGGSPRWGILVSHRAGMLGDSSSQESPLGGPSA